MNWKVPDLKVQNSVIENRQDHSNKERKYALIDPGTSRTARLRCDYRKVEHTEPNLDLIHH